MYTVVIVDDEPWALQGLAEIIVIGTTKVSLL